MNLFKSALSQLKLLRVSFLFFLIFSVFFISSVLGQGFAPKVDYATGVFPFSVFASDLDGDVDLDLVTANLFSDSVSILKNNGDGTFAAKVDYATGTVPYSVFAADLDGDGDFDLAVANLGSNTVSVLKNNGDGTFAPKVDYATGVTPVSVFASDLDGDGDFDLATANLGDYSVSILKNNGDGTFVAKNDFAAVRAWAVFAADLDGDADNDLVLPNEWGPNVSVFMNNGDGTFVPSVSYPTGDAPVSVFAADLDGDTDNDLAVANSSSNTVSILKNLTPMPKIISITDVGNDQGKQVRIRWKTTSVGDTLVKKYDIFRRIDGATSLTINGAVSLNSPLRADWNRVATFSAYGDTLYNGIVPTLVDSTVSGGLQWSVFFVRAATNSPVVFYDSPIDSGYSVDNLVPAPPANLQATGTAIIASLHWSPVTSEDFDFYYIYRDTVSGFSLSPAKRVKATSDTLAFDTLSNPNKAYFYRVTAVDFSGNEGPPSNQDQLCTERAGDANGSGSAPNLTDIIYLVNYVFKGSIAPVPLCRGDANGGGGAPNLTDIIYLVNYVFKGGLAPVKPGGCCF